MAQDILRSEPSESEIILSILNEEPLPAALVGELLSALSRDYRQRYRGRTLAVSRLEAGSLLVFLRDAIEQYGKDTVEIAKGGKAILDFAKSIRETLNRKKQPTKDEIRDEKVGPYRSIEAMAKLAAETGSELRVQHTAADGASLDVTLKPAEAVRIREHTRLVQAEAKRLGAQKRLELPHSAQDWGALPVRDLADRLEKIGLPSPESPDSWIGTVVRFLRDTGNVHLVEMLAVEFEGRGQIDLAQAIRLAGSHNDREPPIRLS